MHLHLRNLEANFAATSYRNEELNFGAAAAF